MVTPAAVLIGVPQEPALDRMAVTYTPPSLGLLRGCQFTQLHKTSSGNLTQQMQLKCALQLQGIHCLVCMKASSLSSTSVPVFKVQMPTQPLDSVSIRQKTNQTEKVCQLISWDRYPDMLATESADVAEDNHLLLQIWEVVLWSCGRCACQCSHLLTESPQSRLLLISHLSNQQLYSPV